MLKIDYSSPEPLYSQIRQQILEMLKTKDLSPGSPLPSIRKLSKQLDIAANTVARAYQELEAMGVIVTGGRRGTFIRADWDEPGHEVNRERIVRGIRGLLNNGMSAGEVRDFLESVIEKEAQSGGSME